MVGFQLTAKCQITVPKDVRHHLGLGPGDKVIFQIKDDEVIIKGFNNTLFGLRGSVKRRGKPENHDHVRRQVKENISRRIARG